MTRQDSDGGAFSHYLGNRIIKKKEKRRNCGIALRCFFVFFAFSKHQLASSTFHTRIGFADTESGQREGLLVREKPFNTATWCWSFISLTRYLLFGAVGV